MGISRSSFYDAPRVELDDTALVEAMAAICDEFEAYGGSVRVRGGNSNDVRV